MSLVLPLACCVLFLGPGRTELFFHSVDVPQERVIRSTEDVVRVGRRNTKISGAVWYELANHNLVAKTWPEEKLLWTFSPRFQETGRFVITKSAVICDCGNKVYVLDRASGKVAVVIAAPEQFKFWPEVLTPVQTATGLGTQRDAIVHQSRHNEDGHLSPAIPPDLGGRLIFRSQDRGSFALTAMSEKTGERLWQVNYGKLPGHPNYYFWPYCNASGGLLRLWCWPTLWNIDLASGEKKQDVSLPDANLRWFHIDERTLTVALEMRVAGRLSEPVIQPVLRGVDLASGNRLWEEDIMTTGTFLGPVKATAIAVGTDKQLRLLDTRTGKDQWPPLELPVAGRPIMIVAGKGDLAYLATATGLYRLDMAKGTIDWHTPAAIHSELVLHPAGLLHCRAAFSGRGNKSSDFTTQVYLVRRSPETGAVESEIEIQRHLGAYSSFEPKIESVDERRANISITLFTSE